MMTNRKYQLRSIVLTGLMTALVFLGTSVIKIPTVRGYIHLGDGFVFLSVIILGPFYGAFAAGVGSMLADILGGYAQWALPTLLIKSLMAFSMGIIIRQQAKSRFYIAAVTTLVVWTVFFTSIKSGLVRAVKFSLESLAESMEDAPEIIADKASEIQWILTIAIIAILVLAFILILWLAKKRKDARFGPSAVLGMMTAGAVMVIGYYIAEYVIYSNPIVPIFSVPTNLIQFTAGIIISVAIAQVMIKAAIPPETDMKR